jgi:hypothetical protein
MSLDEGPHTTNHSNAVSTGSPVTAGVVSSAPTPPVPNSHPAAVVTPPVPTVEPPPIQIEDFDAIIRDDVQKFMDLADKVGGLVAEQVGSALRGISLNACNLFHGSLTCTSQKLSSEHSRRREHLFMSLRRRRSLKLFPQTS